MKFTLSGSPTTLLELKKFIDDAVQVGAADDTKVQVRYQDIEIHIGTFKPARPVKHSAKKATS